MTTRSHKRPSRFSLLVGVLAICGIAAGAIISGGFSWALFPAVAVAALIWGGIWMAGFQVGHTFAVWLEKRLYK